MLNWAIIYQHPPWWGKCPVRLADRQDFLFLECYTEPDTCICRNSMVEFIRIETKNNQYSNVFTQICGILLFGTVWRAWKKKDIRVLERRQKKATKWLDIFYVRNYLGFFGFRKNPKNIKLNRRICVHAWLHGESGYEVLFFLISHSENLSWPYQ